MDKSTLADIALYQPSQVTDQGIEDLEACAIFSLRCDEYRRRFKEGEVPISYMEAVKTYGLVAPLLTSEPDPEFAEWLDNMGAIASPRRQDWRGRHPGTSGEGDYRGLRADDCRRFGDYLPLA